MDLACGEFIKNTKQVQKFILKYMRFLYKHHDTDIEDRLIEFQPHLDRLFSGRGGWSFPEELDEKGNLYYHTSCASKSLVHFFEENKNFPQVGSIDKV